MNSFAIFALGLFIALSVIILLSAIFSRIPRKIGFRNVRRRLGNTLLVITGSMVGTALISGSLVLSDSLDKTFFNLVKEQVGEADAFITLSPKNFSDTGFTLMTTDEANAIADRISKDESKVDAVFPYLNFVIAPQKIDKEGNPVLNVYQVDLRITDFESLNKFGSNPIKFDIPEKENGVAISKTMSEQLEVEAGNTIRFFYAGENIDLLVDKVYEDEGIIGGKVIFAQEDYIYKKLNIPEGFTNTIVISAKGGIEPDNYNGKEFKEYIEQSIKEFKSENYTLNVLELKQIALDGFGLKLFVNIFVVLSLFGIASGILLIVNLYMMLASERKSEMGILRAIALTRFQLIKVFVYEGYLYSVLASFVGALVGLLIGYALVLSLSTMFQSLFELGGGVGFEIQFDVKPSSLVAAFSIGAVITIVTAIIASFRISKLNIVSAIRDTEEIKQHKLTMGWFIKTGLLILVFLNSLLTFLLSFVVGEALDNTRESNASNNPLKELTDERFDIIKSLYAGYMLYFGFVTTVLFGTFLINRIASKLFKKDISRITYSLSSIVLILFTGLMSEIESISKAVEQNEGIALFFLSGAVLVLSAALLITYNLSLIIGVTTSILSRLKIQTAVIRIALRYPAENKSRTGLTMIMFALILFLISFVSITKALSNEQNRNLIENLLSGYDVIIRPLNDGVESQDDKIIAEINSLDFVKDVDRVNVIEVELPEYKYGELSNKNFFGDPSQIPLQSDEDNFVTRYSILPENFIRTRDIGFSEYSREYKSEKEVWEALINEPDKIILGVAYSAVDGYGRRPNLKIGDKVIVGDIFGEKTSTKEVIGIISESEGGSFGVDFYTYLVTSENTAKNDFTKDYIDKLSDTTIMVGLEEGARGDQIKDIKKEIVDYNIIFVLGIDDLAGAAEAFINGIMSMLQGFLAFSLIVGTSGLAIILVRSVNERRQQIGMLRSLGFQRRMILFSFFIESTFITFMSILIGISMGLVSSNSIIEIGQRTNPDMSVTIPWVEIIIISILVYIASILFSLLPSLKAAKLSPVEATNYPE